MRIIAGEHRGRVLKAPKGEGTRPTTDRVRESLMSALASARGGFDGAVALDAFAGSGALGLEALSRGAAWACAFEVDGAAAAVVRANAELLGYGADRFRLVKADALERQAPLPPAGARYDLVMLDPPYALPAADALGVAARLGSRGLLADGCLISYEHDAASNDEVDACLEGLPLRLRSRRAFGSTAVDLIEREER